MRVTGAGPRDRVAMAAALRRGECLVAGAGALGDADAPDIVPLCTGVEDPAQTKWLPPAAAPGSAYSVAAVIPSSRWVPWGLAALAAQDVRVEVDVLANGSFRSGRVVAWQGHGATRRLAVDRVTHPYVLLLVDDAIPLGAGFVRTLVEALEEGGHDAVFARQIPWPDADFTTRTRIRAWTPPMGPVPPGRLDNVAALYRTRALQDDPFDDVPIAEDWHWGRRHTVGYVPTSPVLHSHPRSFWDLYRRTQMIHREMCRVGEPALSTRTLIGALPSVVGPDLPGALAELLGQWRGGQGRAQ